MAAAEKYMKQQEYAKAIEALATVIRDDVRGNPEVYLKLAACHLNLQQQQEAIEICERALELHPESERLEGFYVTVLRAAVKSAERRAKLEQRLAQKSDSPVYLKALGELYMEEANSSKAEHVLARAARLQPRDPEAHYLYGKWACLNNQESLCVAEMTRALALTPGNDQAKMQIYTLIGVAEIKLSRPLRAEAAFRSAWQFNQKLASPNPQAGLEFVTFLVGRARDAEARQVIDRILEWAPVFAPAHFERAKLLARQGKMEQALDQANTGLQLAGDDKSQLRALHAFLAKTYFALGRVQEAQRHQNWIESHQ